jgi:hypothetical protein
MRPLFGTNFDANRISEAPAIFNQLTIIQCFYCFHPAAFSRPDFLSKKQAPGILFVLQRVLGIPGLDSILTTNIRFLSDVLSGPDYARVVLGYACSVALAWHVAAGIESSRADSHRNVLLRSVSLLVFLSVAVGPALVVPLLWIGPYVILNKVSCHYEITNLYT